MNPYFIFGQKGFKVIADTAEAEVPFFCIIPLEDAVIADIEFPPIAPEYNGDATIVGKTLPKGVPLYIWGDTITLTSGSVILMRR